MADVDLGTEHMRWMGGTRFVVGFIQRALAGPRYDCEVSMRIIESDKHRMKEEILAMKNGGEEVAGWDISGSFRAKNSSSSSSSPSKYAELPNDNDDMTGLPPLRFGTINDPIPASPDSSEIEGSKATGWTTVNAPLCTLYAGQVPYLADNLLQFPIANSDGSIVVSILPVVSTGTLLAVRSVYFATTLSFSCTSSE